MQEYEVIREIYNACSGKWEVDNSFTREIQTDSIERTMQDWFKCKLPPHQVDTLPDGTVAYVLDPPQRERYSFTTF